MSDMNNAVLTGNESIFQQRLDRKQMVEFIELVATRAKAADDALTTTMNNALTLVGQRLDEIDLKAQVFDKAETEQLEAAFQQFLTTSGVSNLLGAMSISLNGTSYSVQSVISTLVNADKIASKEILAVDGNDMPEQIKYILHDGYEVIMDYTRSDDPDTGITTISGVANDWRGLVATETLEYQAVSADRNIMGVTYSDVRYNLARSISIMFDLTGLLSPASAVSMSAPDIDGDGIIGATTP